MKTTLPENEKALWVLKKKGAQPISVIASELDITIEGARFHLLKLEKEGLVQSRSVAKGRGRPKQIWSLTDKSNSRFPDTHANLTANLINMMRETLGEDAVKQVIEKHESTMLSRYSKEIQEDSDLESRIAQLADIRTRDGYMAEYEKDEEGFLLIENHCPICVAAKACQQFCRAEMNIFQSVLGEDVHIKRTEHIVAGERRCAYKIKPSI
ncbi:MAG: transcriptional regulator [Balneolaceae bacterium]|nr:transcriptional regulator [Balneolaceae bacterium]